MIGHYQRKWSASARWCERIAALAIPYFVLAILLHRTAQISPPQAYWLMGGGLVLLLLSLVLGVHAFFDLWYSGRKGGKATLRGLLMTMLMLLPYLWFGYLGIVRPPVSDVSTDTVSPPAFRDAARLREQNRALGMNTLANYDEFHAETIRASYPGLASRRYNAGAERVLGAVRALIADRSWQLVSVYGLPSDSPAEESEEEVDTATDGEPVLEGEIPGDIVVEAVSKSLVFGFPQDIAVEIISEAESTLVDMRASTRWGRHDFGRNAEIIREFLQDLDEALLGIAGEG